jgi:putative membrane protein
MRSPFMFAGAVAAALLLGAPAQAAEDTSQFLQDTIQTNLAEIQMGQLAQEKGESQEVKDFGITQVQDHTAANEKATALAEANNVTPPDQPKAEDQQAYQMLAEMSDGFDKAFAEHMVEGHQKAIEMFEGQQDDPNQDVAAFAKETLPTLQSHLETAQSIAGM